MSIPALLPISPFRTETPPRGMEAVLHDRARLQEIAALDLTSPDVDPVLEDMARAAAAHFGLPIAMVSVVLDEAQFVAAMYGVDGWMKEARGHPVEWSLCRYAVQSGESFVVEDAERHPLTRDNPMVTLEGLRCYAGIPLVSANGHALGAFCAAGAATRAFTAEEMDDLRAFAAAAMARLQARRAK